MFRYFTGRSSFVSRSFASFLFLFWIWWIGPGICLADDFTMRFSFLPDPDNPIHGVSMDGNCQDQGGYQIVEENDQPSYKGTNRWEAKIDPIHAIAGDAFIGGQGHATFEWRDNALWYDLLAESESRGATWLFGWFSASMITSSTLSGTIQATIESSCESDGTPVYLTTRDVPGSNSVHSTCSTCTTEADCGFIRYQRTGPEWSEILQNISFPDDPYIYQVGDRDAAVTYANALACSISRGDIHHWASASLNGRQEYRIRKPEPGSEYTGNIFEDRPNRSHFKGIDQNHACFYAAMAMILDDWAQTYPELKKNSAAEYYAALDKCADPKLKYLEGGVAKLNNYFAAKNGCRTGRAVPLRAVGPRYLANLSIEQVRSPLIVTGCQILGDNSLKLPMEANLPHAMVVDGYYRVRNQYGDWSTWLAVRDTWNDGLTPAVSVTSYGKAQFRSFGKDGREWWPLDYDYEDGIYFPTSDQKYGFHPNCYIEIERTFPFNGFESEINLRDLYSEDFDQSIGPGTTPAPTPSELWQRYSLISTILVAPADARALVSLVIGPPENEEEDDDSGYRLRVRLQQPVTAAISATCYSSRKVNIAFDYACVSGTLQLYAGDTLLAAIPRTADSELTNYSKTFTLSSEATTTFSLRLTGSTGNELYLDNLSVTNPVADQIRIDLNDSGRVDYLDFASFSAQWPKTGCTAPNYCQGADIDHSGKVDLSDLLLLIDEWMWIDPDIE